MTFTRALPFQSTFPRGERRGPYLIFLSPCRFQSTFPRGERHLCWLVAVKHIHFNPRSLVGNDDFYEEAAALYLISIHVPSWGTTFFVELLVLFCFISIHVPSWGTTANFHKYSLFFYAINIIFLLFIIPSLFSLVLFMLLF